MPNRNHNQRNREDIPGSNRATGVDDPTPRSEYGDDSEDIAPPHVATGDSEKESEAADLPDSLEYSIEWTDSYGWTITIESGCPECGYEDVFNAEIELGAQFVTYDSDDAGNPVLGQDDTYRAELTFARCNNCWTTLVDERNGKDDRDE